MKFRDIKEYLAFNNRYPELTHNNSLMYECPFHGGMSFHVTLDEQGGMWNCFGCGLGGSFPFLIFLLERYTEKEWPKVYDIIAGRESLAAKPPIVSPTKKKRSTLPADDTQRAILTFLTTWWHEQLFAPTGQAKQARLYLALKRGVTNYVQQNPLLGYAPGDPDGSCCEGLARHITQRFGYYGLQTATRLGIFREDTEKRELTLRLQYRIMFSCLDPVDQRTVYYQGRVVEPHPSQYPKIGPSGIAKMPFWIPIAEPAIEGTIGCEASLGVCLLAYYHIPALATLGEGFDPVWLNHFAAPFFWAQDNDEPITGRGGTIIQAGEKQAQKCITLCRDAGLTAYRLEPPRFSRKENGIDDWIKRQGIGPIYDKRDELLGITPSQDLGVAV